MCMCMIAARHLCWLKPWRVNLPPNSMKSTCEVVCHPLGVIIFLVGSVVKFVLLEKRDFQQVVFAKTDAVI